MTLRTRTRRFGRAILMVLASGIAVPAAMAWTDKPVKMLVPAPAGGSIDVIARLVADQLTTDLGQPMVVENKPGAGGAIAVQALRAAPADGQTVMMIASNVLTEIPHVLKGGFDPLKDVKPVGIVARANLVMIAAPNVPAKDFKGFLAYAKKNPGSLSFASYSAGTISHYTGMILNQKAGLDLQHVPFQGSPPALAQVMGGQIPMMFDGYATSRNLIEAAVAEGVKHFIFSSTAAVYGMTGGQMAAMMAAGAAGIPARDVAQAAPRVRPEAMTT